MNHPPSEKQHHSYDETIYTQKQHLRMYFWRGVHRCDLGGVHRSDLEHLQDQTYAHPTKNLYIYDETIPKK